jgi:N-acylglucosamine 2-epimerase
MINVENSGNEKVAGLTPQQLLKEYNAYLFDDFLPFMEKHVVDHENGGFMCHTDRLGNNLNTNKRAWFDGRGIWVYSYLYNNFKQDPAYLKIAKDTVRLLMKCEPSGSNFWPWSYSRTGIDLKERTSDIYGSLFVAEGLTEYSVASGDASYWDKAKSILLQCLALYDSPDYFCSLDDDCPDISEIEAPRILGHWMIMLRLITEMLRIREDKELEDISERCVEALMHSHLNPQFGLLNEVLNHDLTIPQGPFSQLVYIGHAIEALWMVMDEALRREDIELFSRASLLFKRHVEIAWDDVYGGVFHCLTHTDNNVWVLNKLLWAQEEVLVGLILLIEHSDDAWAYQWFDKIYNYVIDKFPLEKHGYPLWNIGGDRKMTFKKEGIRIENYHHPRHLMFNIQALERIIDRSESIVH